MKDKLILRKLRPITFNCHAQLHRLFRTSDLKGMIFSVNTECLLLVENVLECSHAGCFLTDE